MDLECFGVIVIVLCESTLLVVFEWLLIFMNLSD